MKKWIPILLLLSLTSSAFAVKAWVRNTFRGYQDGVYEPEETLFNGKASYKLPGADWYVRWIVDYPSSGSNSWSIITSEDEILYYVQSDADDPPNSGWVTTQSDPSTPSTPSGLQVLEAISGNGAYTREAEDYNGYASYRKDDDSRWLVRFIDGEWRIYRPGFMVAYSIYALYTPLSSGWSPVSATPTVDIVPDDFVLPVSLVSLEAELEQNRVILTWQTHSESENLGFILERRSSANAWQWLADYNSHDALGGKGTVTDTTLYTFTDDRIEPGLILYRLWQQDINGQHHYVGEISITVPENTLPETFTLLPAFPNPFNMTTTCTIKMPYAAPIEVKVISMNGQVIKTLYRGELNAGTHYMQWDGRNDRNVPVPSGVYLIDLSSPTNHKVRKVSLVK